MQKVMTWFERIIISALILLMAITVLFSARVISNQVVLTSGGNRI